MTTRSMAMGLMALAVGVTGCRMGGRSPAEAMKGRQAPDFDLAATDGSRVKLSALRGKPVVVAFSATW